jgi:heat shock protein HslJ
MVRPERKILALAILALASLIAGCDANRREAGQLRPSPDLAGTEWVLTSLGDSDLIQDTYITLYFEERFLGGSMACNGYGGGPDSGRYRAEEDGTLTLPQPLAVTVQLCSSPPGIMEQEDAYIEALLNAAAYRVIDDRLEVDDAAAETTLVFARKE